MRLHSTAYVGQLIGAVPPAPRLEVAGHTPTTVARARRAAACDDIISPLGTCYPSWIFRTELLLLCQLEAGGAIRARAMSAIHGYALQLASTADGCRTLAVALALAGPVEAAVLAAELRGHVRKALDSSYLNYVIRTVIAVLPPSLSNFIAEELFGIVSAVARHHQGCRLLCRLLEFHVRGGRGQHAVACSASGEDVVAASLAVDELLEDQVAGRLCRHSCGHRVMRAVLEHGLPAHQHRAAVLLRGELLHNALHPRGSSLLMQALQHCCAEDRRAIAEELLCSPQSLLLLAMSRSGNCLLPEALEHVPTEVSVEALRRIRSYDAELRATKHGRRLLDLLTKA